MKILVCGATGFIGSALCRRLAQSGHVVLRGVRRPIQAGDISIDYAKDTEVEVWRERLAGVDLVINAVGVINESHDVPFDMVHHRVPAALFEACAEAGMKRVVQISALGAEGGDTPYFRSKYAADAVLMGLPVEWQILRPSLVYGSDGASAALFRMLASLPLIPLPDLGDALFQPIHIDDLVDAVERVIDPQVVAGQQIDLVGVSAVRFPDMVTCYGEAMGLAKPAFLRVPARLMDTLAVLLGALPGALLTPDNWRMLRAGSTASAQGVIRLLGRPPRRIDDFIPPECAESMRVRALSAWRAPLLRYVLAIVWITTAYVSLLVYPVSASLALLERVGLSGLPASVVLHGASLLDLAMGVACLRNPGRMLWQLQTLVVGAYSLIIAILIPEYLAHPFGPVTKNLPILAILLILGAEST